jgi:hypothetical protein
MSLREQFEAWVIQHPRNKGLSRVRKYPSVPVSVAEAYADSAVELAWRAYQAGHAASGRDELLGMLQVVMDDSACEGLPEHKRQLAETVIKKARVE